MKSPQALTQWETRGVPHLEQLRVAAKCKLDPRLIEGYSAVMPTAQPDHKTPPSEPAGQGLSPDAMQLVELIREADTSQSVTSDSWKQLAGIVKTMMKPSGPTEPVPKGFSNRYASSGRRGNTKLGQKRNETGRRYAGREKGKEK